MFIRIDLASEPVNLWSDSAGSVLKKYFKEYTMSQAHAQAFLERMQSDDAFNDAVTRIEDVETKMAYINREGYDFTAEDLEMTSYQNSADQNAECP